MTTVITTHPKARKIHYCEMCRRVISPGEQYSSSRNLGDGTAFTWKECAHCAALLTYVLPLWGDDEYGPDHLVDWDPNTIDHFRLKALATRRQWRHRDGSLYPVPELVWHTDADGFGRVVNIRSTPAEES